MKLIAKQEPWNKEVEFLLFGNLVNGQPSIGDHVVMVPRMPDSYIAKPTFALREDDVQDLFNQFWAMGYRPKDGTGNSGHIEALKYHLEDMRKLVFEKTI